MKIKNVVFIVIIVGIILTIPLIIMQFTDEVNWSINDFVIMGSLLLTTGIFLDLVLEKIKNPSLKVIMVIIILGIFLLIWSELAVEAVSKMLKFLFE